jgi:two-component system chemotaxis response regulator CheY
MASLVVIDDNAGSRHFVAEALRLAGHEVQEVEPTCLFTILEVLHHTRPDLLVTDLVMPGCPGQTLIRVCREDAHLRSLRILLLTAHGDQHLARFIQTMGNIHYLAKPVSPTMLQECVELLLDQGLETNSAWSVACNGVVAVVDDSRMSRTFHAACLRKRGFRGVQIEPTDLLETVRAIEASHPDLLLLDYLMPNFNGDALVRAIRGRQACRDLPVLIVTSQRDDNLIAIFLPMGGVEIAFKPIAPDDLVARVSAVIAGGAIR